MTRDDIMALANQTAGQHWMDEAHIQRFAALIAAAAYEECAKVCESVMPNPVQNWADAQIVNALRECAVVIRARNKA